MEIITNGVNWDVEIPFITSTSVRITSSRSARFRAYHKLFVLNARFGCLSIQRRLVVDGLLSSINIFSLPPEILSIIFKLGKNMVSDDPLDEEGLPYNTMAFMLAVSQTCTYFRIAALRTPSLWTSIEISGIASLGWASVCIERTGACNLDILIDFSDGTLMHGRELECMLGLITPHSRRWCGLAIRSVYERVLNPIITRLCSHPVPRLQHLSLEVDDVEHIYRFDIDRDSKHPQIFETGTPHLRFVRLRGMAIHFCRPQLDRVVTLHLDHTIQVPISYSMFCGIITQSTCLEHLSICGDFIDRQSWPGRSNVIRLCKLHSLRLCGVGGEIYAGVLLGIETPSLKSLIIKDLQEEDLDMLWQLNDGSRYSNLTHLAFYNFDLSENTYKLLCQTFYNIVSFSVLYSSIVECPMTHLLLEGTAIGQNGRPFLPWPKLEDVAFSYDGTEEEKQLIQRLVRSRCVQGSPLSRFRLRADPEDEEDILAIKTGGTALCESHPGSEIWPQDRSFFDYNDTIFPG
ncbi:hypothetical protein CVT25_007117 [Psilocybe cyanescens]|uniref:Uncharacterized protein n=1 Tax=Psilocybe cyanescens TaxID=93625 RepID=A0A409WVS0_PSICY|nr:hypothetical protein CVT25_007117 [Psilocybe cyanescens]